jgi:hypothetical protein
LQQCVFFILVQEMTGEGEEGEEGGEKKERRIAIC